MDNALVLIAEGRTPLPCSHGRTPPTTLDNHLLLIRFVVVKPTWIKRVDPYSGQDSSAKGTHLR